MKRISWLILPLMLLFTAACISSKAMELTYNVASAPTLKDYTVFLVVNDHRSTPDLIGAKAKEKELFPELANGYFDLKVNMPGGKSVTVTNVSATEAVYEAASRKLQAQGVVTTKQKSAAHLTVEVNIENMNIDLVDGDLFATVDLAAQVYRDSTSVAKSQAKATSNRMKLVGGTGGATILSDALSQALNDLDFSGINRF